MGRCDLERGAGKVQLLARLLPNIFQDGYKPSVIEPLVDKIRANLFGAEATDPLDFLQLYWWDPKVRGWQQVGPPHSSGAAVGRPSQRAPRPATPPFSLTA